MVICVMDLNKGRKKEGDHMRCGQGGNINRLDDISAKTFKGKGRRPQVHSEELSRQRKQTQKLQGGTGKGAGRAAEEEGKGTMRLGRGSAHHAVLRALKGLGLWLRRKVATKRMWAEGWHDLTPVLIGALWLETNTEKCRWRWEKQLGCTYS